MTNAEKYLKEGVENIESLIQDFFHFIGCVEDSNRYNDIYQFFLNKAEPTLTEDERVILRNIDKDFYKFIGRQAEMLYVSRTAHYFNTDSFDNYFGNGCLFQFIKERRRIRDKRIIKIKYALLPSSRQSLRTRTRKQTPCACVDF